MHPRLKPLARLALVAASAVLAGTGWAAAVPSPAVAAPATCTAGLTIFTTSTGITRQAGDVTVFRGSGVGGQYTSGELQGYTLSGAQDIILDRATGQSELAGSYVATSPDGT